MFNKILVALDRGDMCANLFKKAVGLAKVTDAQLMLLSVLTPEAEDGLTKPATSGLDYYSLSMSEAMWEMYQANLERYEAEGLERLQGLTEKAQAAGVQTEFTQAFGSPGRAICDLARTWEADLIMVGTRGRQGISEMLLGSVSNYVTHHSPCSVVVMKAQGVIEEAVEVDSLATVAG